MKLIRALVAAWVVVALSCAAWPMFFGGWADWPAQAQAYAQWAQYQFPRLPFAYYAGLIGLPLLVVGAAAMCFRPFVGAPIFGAALVLHAYFSFLRIPVIASSVELMLRAAFYVLAGLAVGAALQYGRGRDKHAD